MHVLGVPQDVIAGLSQTSGDMGFTRFDASQPGESMGLGGYPWRTVAVAGDLVRLQMFHTMEGVQGRGINDYPGGFRFGVVGALPEPYRSLHQSDEPTYMVWSSQGTPLVWGRLVGNRTAWRTLDETAMRHAALTAGGSEVAAVVLKEWRAVLRAVLDAAAM